MNELLSLNVSGHIEKKNGLSYLSWAWAWAEALKHDPEATWCVHTYAGGEEPYMRVGKTAMVHVSVTLKGIRRECMLPVMDHRNKAIPDPDAFAVNTAIMRCMTKALSMHGLGLYIYAGEDLPEGAPEPTAEEELVPALEASIAQAKQKKNGAMGDAWAEADRNLAAETRRSLRKFSERIAPMSPVEAYELIEEQGLDEEEKTYLWGFLDSKLRSAMKTHAQTQQLIAMKETA